jgi:predicted NodU family carbamoyl transferase
MLTLGLSGNFSAEGQDLVPNMHWGFFHDSAACLIRDGVLLAAVEEERLNRIKKTSKFPVNAIRSCLAVAGCSAADIDGVAYPFPEQFIDHTLNSFLYLDHPQVPTVYSRQLVGDWMLKEFGKELPSDRLIYSSHHLTHAMSAFARSGMSEALVVVMDGNGEEESTTIFRAATGKMESLAKYSIPKSLGNLYLSGTLLLGYGFGDEYKVMGLAPYGRPEKYRAVFDKLYTLLPDGEYEFHHAGPGLTMLAPIFLLHGLKPRRKGEELAQEHKDFAAGLQEMLERIATHVITHWARSTGLRRAAISGGVAHNSSLNGLILRSGLFDEVFVHPASHDAGAAEGAALFAERRMGGAAMPRVRMRSASLGPDLGDSGQIEKDIRSWDAFVDVERPEDIVAAAAGLLADGAVLGWAQGRSEFGPRALGNRSILADARPAQNRTRINAMIKKREGYRPFAPVVTAEAAGEYFEIPPTVASYDFMSFVVPVREDRREELGAVTHIDGTARLQVADKAVNERFHRLVATFGEITGTPVLLNTSFNNNAEPIVQDVDEAMTCYLTSGLDYVVIADFLIRRKESALPVEELVIGFRPPARLARRSMPGTGSGDSVVHEIYLDYRPGRRMEVSAQMYGILERADGKTPVCELGVSLTGDLRTELFDLWQNRLITMTPRRLSGVAALDGPAVLVQDRAAELGVGEDPEPLGDNGVPHGGGDDRGIHARLDSGPDRPAPFRQAGRVLHAGTRAVPGRPVPVGLVNPGADRARAQHGHPDR